MSDSVDRVFVHALNTVKRIPRTGSARPPEADRLRLYGLYKQSMEGDVEGVMPRPKAGGTDGVSEVEKWEAWHSRAGMSRTEAKRQYISTLIETMHQYATTTSEARELVAELEFVWHQIRSNSASSAGSSPGQPSRSRAMQQNPSSGFETRDMTGSLDRDGLRVLRPLSDRDEEDELEELDVADDRGYKEGENEGRNTARSALPDMGRLDARWKKRVEQALFTITTEIAALREQMEAATLNDPRKRRGVWACILWLTRTSIRHLLIDAALVGLLILWNRKKKDARVEQGLRILRFWSRQQMSKLQIPRLTSNTSNQ